jgi:4-hydroxy-tetrahydrodipicolinate reductase
MPALRVLSFGLGPIGAATARLALTKKTIQLVGAVDIDAAKKGKDLGAVLGLAPTGVIVSGDAEAAFAELRPDSILHCTSSFLPVVKEQLLVAARHGIDVVSSTEELLVPDLQHPDIAREIDEAAKKGGATILGTGVNPGYAMDTLAVFATAACRSVEMIECWRVVDAGKRRLPLQKKVGAGMSADEFRKEVATGRFGHIGLRESIALVGRACGWKLDTITQSVESVIAERDEKTEFLNVKKGQVAGIWNHGIGKEGGRVRVEMDLKMFVGAKDPFDAVKVTGHPPMHLRVEGGTPGDLATAAMLVNMLPRVAAARPGLLTMLDLPVPGIAT